MNHVVGRGLILLGACALLAACSGSSDTTTGYEPGAGGTSQGTGGEAGAAGSATGGAAGSATGGAGGSDVGGAGGSGAGGTAAGGSGGTTADNFWPDTYNASGMSNPSSGKHNAGKVCGQCHTGGGAPAWSFAGTVYQAGGTTGAPHVEVGVRVNGTTHTTYSGQNGNFFLSPGTSIDFTQAEVRIRNANGEAQMGFGAGGRWCNSCHSVGNRIIQP